MYHIYIFITYVQYQIINRSGSELCEANLTICAEDIEKNSSYFIVAIMAFVK